MRKLGAKFGHIVTNETRDKIRNKLKGRHPKTEWKKGDNIGNTHGFKKGHIGYWKDKNRSEDTKIKISFSNKGKVVSEDTCRKISESLKGEKNPMFGISRSIETKRKIGEGNRGKFVSEDTKQKISKATKGNLKIIAACAKQKFPFSDNGPEKIMQKALEDVGIPFRAQEPIFGIPDFYIPEYKICIMVDGDYFHAWPGKYDAEYYNKKCKKTAQQIWDRDKKVTETLQSQGYIVLRFWEHEIKYTLIDCIGIIKAQVGGV